MDVEERVYFRARAREMAPMHARWLMSERPANTLETNLVQVVDLIRDCSQHLDRPELTIMLALHFQPIVEGWSTWGLWTAALDHALTATRQTADLLNEIRLLNHRSEAARGCNEYEAAHALALQALDLANNYQQFELVAMSLNQLGRIAYVRDQLELARDYWEQAYRIGEAHCSAVELGRMALNGAVVAINQLRFEDAEQRVNLANHYFEIVGDPVWLAKAKSTFAALRYAQGHISTALLLWQATSEAFQVAGNHYARASDENAIGCALLQLGQWAAAREHLHIAANTYEQLGSLVDTLSVMANLITLNVTMEEWEQAEVMISAGRTLAITADKPLIVAAIDVDYGRMLLARGDAEGARQAWERGQALQQAAGAWEAAHKTELLLSTFS